MRNDSSLYTGLTSKVEKAATDRKIRKEKKQSTQNKLKPAGEIVISALDKELERTQAELLSMIGIKNSDEEVKDIIVALNMYTESIKRLKVTLKNLLRSDV